LSCTQGEEESKKGVDLTARVVLTGSMDSIIPNRSTKMLFNFLGLFIQRFLKPRLLIFIASSFVPALTVHAAALAWDGSADSSWNNLNNWTPAQLPAAGDIVTLGNTAPNAAQAITNSGSAFVQRLSLDGTLNRTYSVSGGTLEFQRFSGTNPDLRWSTSAGRQNAVINSNIRVSGQTETENVAFTIAGGNADTPTLTINGNLSGSTGPGFGARTWSYTSVNRLIMNGSNSLDSMGWTAGEIVVGNSSALGLGLIQFSGVGNATLSLRSDLSIGKNPTDQSILSNKESFLRIAEAAPGGTANRTVTLAGRLFLATGTNQKITFLNNINSTGTLIMVLNDTSATAHNLDIALNSTGLLRFGQAGNKTYSAIISGNGNVNVASTGTTTLTMANTYTGTTTVTAGTLLLSSTGSISNSSAIDFTASGNGTLNVSAVNGFQITANQTLRGTGTVTGNLTVARSGILAPGNSAGTITFNNDLTLAPGSVSNFEINGLTAGLYDLAIGGAGPQTVNFGGTLNLTFQSGFNTLGTVKIFDFETYAGTFAGVATTGLASGFTASFSAVNGVVTVVPEPTTWALLVAFLSVVVTLRRWKSFKKLR